MIEIQNLTKRYDANTVVDNVSLTVDTGQIAALVGTSGSGKTTLLRMINRLVEPSGARVLIDGEQVRIPSPGDPVDPRELTGPGAAPGAGGGGAGGAYGDHG